MESELKRSLNSVVRAEKECDIYCPICHKLLQDAGLDVTYEEGPGDHNWDFWDTYIKRIIDWLPLDPESRGRNSGNVH